MFELLHPTPHSSFSGGGLCRPAPLLCLTEKKATKKSADKAPTSQNLQNKKPTRHRQGTDKGTAADIPQKGLRRFAHFGTREFFTDKAYRQGHRQGTDDDDTTIRTQ